MQKTKNWRDVLGNILSDARVKQRVAHNLHVSTFTLQRWVRGDANPHTRQLHQLLQTLPQHQNVLLPLIAEELEGGKYHMLEQAEKIEEVPSVFYAQVLRGSTTIPTIIRFWSLANMILQQALMQLDPQRNGLLLRVARFLPPNTDGRLYCLREAVALGTSLWEGNLIHTAILLGAESLAGQALATGQPLEANLQDKNSSSSIVGREDEVSRLAIPIMRGNRAAGVFLLSSAQADFFTPARLLLSLRYTDLLALTFEGEDFYVLDQLDLSAMPTPAAQEEPLATFRQRVATLLVQREQQQLPIDAEQAETQIWQQFAQEFL